MLLNDYINITNPSGCEAIASAAAQAFAIALPPLVQRARIKRHRHGGELPADAATNSGDEPNKEINCVDDANSLQSGCKSSNINTVSMP